jgi:hypothetical protein
MLVPDESEHSSSKNGPLGYAVKIKMTILSKLTETILSKFMETVS